VERTLVAAAEDAQGRLFGERIQRFQLTTGWGGPGLRRHGDQRIDEVVYRHLDELFGGRVPVRTAVDAT
jgi:hypothetical protein